MKAAIIAEAAGSPHALAMTSFVGALAEGLNESGARTHIIGLASTPGLWFPEAFGNVEWSAPWLEPSTPRASDLWRAVRAGVLDDLVCGEGACARPPLDWYAEWLLDRQLDAIAGNDPSCTVLVYPRVLAMLVPCVRSAKRHGLKVLVFATEALTDNQIDSTTRDEYIRCVVECCEGVLAASQHLAGFWESHGVAPGRILVSPPAIGRGHLAVTPHPARAASAVFIGNLAHRDVEYLLEIAGRVVLQVPEFTLAIYGDATDEERADLTHRIASRGLGEAVRVREPVPPLGVPNVLASADVLLLPRSRGEFSTAGFPKKLGEYLASGRPTVVTAVGDISRYLTDGEHALLVEPDDCEAFATAVIRVLEDAALGDRIGAAGRARAETTFLAPVLAARLMAFASALSPREATWIRHRRLGTIAGVSYRAAVPRVKRAVVRVLRALHLKRPAPESERRH